MERCTKMKNKTLVRLFSVVLASVMLCSCGDNTTDNSNITSQDDNSQTVSVDMSNATVIVENGKTEYVVVRAKDGTAAEKDAATDLRELISNITGADVKLRSDSKEAAPYEIIVGKASRDAVAGIELAENEYLVANKDGVIIILGGSEKAFTYAYNYFVNNYVTSETIAVPKDLEVKEKYKTREEQLTVKRLVKYPEYSEDVMPRDFDYTVKVRQGSETIEIPVYNPVCQSEYFNSTMDGDWHRRYCEFAFSGEPVTIEVTVNMDFSSYSVMPSSKEIASTCNGNVITYTIDKPQNTVIKINNNRDTMLAIFAEEPLLEEDYPNKNALNVIYYEAGYHEVEGGVINVDGGMTLFLEPGAIVKARIKVAADAKVVGRGAIIESSPTRMDVNGQRYMVSMSGSNILIDGIKILDSRDYNITAGTIENVEIKNVKVLCNQISTDGFAIWGTGTNVNIHDCFWHISDNVFVIGGKSTPFENFVVQDCIVASDYATFFPQEFAMGGGTILFKNIDILRAGSIMKVTYNPGKHKANFDIVIENINAMDVDTTPRFIWIENYTGTETKNITMKNVALNKINSVGCEIASDVKGFTMNFDNVWIGGKLFDENYNIKNTMDTKTNKFVFTNTNDAKAAKANVKATKKVSSYTAEKVKIADLPVGTKVVPFTEGSATYVSAYEIVKQLGFSDVKLDASTGKLTFSGNGKNYSFTADGANKLVNGRLMVPLTFFSQIGTSASYNASSKTVVVENIPNDENLVKNGDFENGLSVDWVTRNFSQLYLSDEAHGGKYAIRVEKGEKTLENGIYTDIVAILKQHGAGTYKFTAYVKKVSKSDSTKIRMGVTGGYNLVSAPAQKTFDLTDSWQKIEFTYDAKSVSTMKMASLFIGAADGGNIGYLIDDITFVKVN